MSAPESTASLLRSIRACTLCAAHLPLGPRPVIQLDSRARILIAGQAPGARVHHSGVPFDDASGTRLREWMGTSAEVFYDPARVAIVPMGFCYPGTGKSGDLPPRAECAEAWRERVMMQLPRVELTLVIGQYAQRWHLGAGQKKNLTGTVAAWREYGTCLPLPHPSPRNNIWLRKNPWFSQELLPVLRCRVAELLGLD